MKNIRKIIKDNPDMTVREFLELFTDDKLWNNVKENEWEQNIDINVFYGLIVPMRLLNGDEYANCFQEKAESGKNNECAGKNAIYQWSSVFYALYHKKRGAGSIRKSERLGMEKDVCEYTEYPEYIKERYNYKYQSSNVPIKEYANHFFKTMLDDINYPPDKKNQARDIFKKFGLLEGVDEVTDQNNVENTIETTIKEMITEGKCRQIIFTGAPGTGKTRIAQKIAKEIGIAIDDKDCFVQFHPSYDYTDFVEGLRPVEVKTQSGETKTQSGETKIQFVKKMQFVKVDGIFKAFCRKIVEKGDKNDLYFFIIDEINRANLSKVFGELMYCFEKDKRGEKNRVPTQYQNLPTYQKTDQKTDVGSFSAIASDKDVFAKGFYVPENVCIIGTMNDIDRSVDSMDFALRRRFEWVEFSVNDNMLGNAFSKMFSGKPDIDKPDIIKSLVNGVTDLNKYIQEEGASFGLNRQYDISQGQFANIPENRQSTIKDIKDYVWNYRIKSLLREYLRGEDEKSIKGFLDEAAKKVFGKATENNKQDA